MKIYTRTGDRGETSLFDGTRIGKDDIRVESYGTIDELSSFIGYARANIEDQEIRELLLSIQRDLYQVAGELATSDGKVFPKPIEDFRIAELEKTIDTYIAKIPQIDKFIIPGSSKPAAALHLARTVCRRAERRIITLSRDAAVGAPLIKYVNRLSDTLYILARYLEEELSYA